MSYKTTLSVTREYAIDTILGTLLRCNPDTIDHVKDFLEPTKLKYLRATLSVASDTALGSILDVIANDESQSVLSHSNNFTVTS